MTLIPALVLRSLTGCARLQLAFEINEFISRAGFSKESEIDGFDVDEGDYAVVLDVL